LIASEYCNPWQISSDVAAVQLLAAVHCDNLQDQGHDNNPHRIKVAGRGDDTRASKDAQELELK